jgi:hypothetical protein
MKQAQKAQISLIQISVEEKLNDFHKKNGETLNSMEILNDFIFKMNLEFDELIKNLETNYL